MSFLRCYPPWPPTLPLCYVKSTFVYDYLYSPPAVYSRLSISNPSLFTLLSHCTPPTAMAEPSIPDPLITDYVNACGRCSKPVQWRVHEGSNGNTAFRGRICQMVSVKIFDLHAFDANSYSIVYRLHLQLVQVLYTCVCLQRCQALSRPSPHSHDRSYRVPSTAYAGWSGPSSCPTCSCSFASCHLSGSVFHPYLQAEEWRAPTWEQELRWAHVQDMLPERCVPLSR